MWETVDVSNNLLEGPCPMLGAVGEWGMDKGRTRGRDGDRDGVLSVMLWATALGGGDLEEDVSLVHKGVRAGSSGLYSLSQSSGASL